MADLPFGTRLIGQTEKSLGAILLRLLDGTGLTEPDWVVLNLAASGSPDLRARVSEVFHVPERVAAQRIDGLVGRGLLDAATLGATPAGRETFRRVTAGIDDVTRRAWGDVDAAELEVAARVLSTVLTRAQSMLSTVPAVAAT